MTLDSSAGICWSRQIEIQQLLKFENTVKHALVAGTEVVVESTSATTRTVTIYSLSEGRNVKPNAIFTIPASSFKLLYIKSHRVFVASCEDLRLRVFCSKFDEVQCIPTQGSLLCLVYCQQRDEVLAGGIGHLHSWMFKPGRNVLSKSPPFTTTLKALQWVVSLSLSQDGRTLLAITHEGVHIINLQVRLEMAYIPNGHKSGISRALSCIDVCITAGKDGSILVWSSGVAQPLQSIEAHGKQVVSLQIHPSKPHLYTASSDGCIKVWDMSTLTEMYQFYATEGILLDFDLISSTQALCYTSKTVIVLNISMPDSHFSSLSSKVTKLSLSGHPGRLIAMCEDGGVRLVCPVSGVVTNVMFPEFTNLTHSFEDIVYSQEHTSLVVLLKTHEVMIFDAKVNPCCCRVLCTADSPEDGVTCITQGSVSCDGVEVELIFAGHLSGFVSLFSSSSITMAANVCGHKGRVHSLSVSSSDPHLISFGSDQCLKVWSLTIHYGNLQMLALLTMSLDKEQPIGRIVLSHHTICLGYVMGSVKTFSFVDCADGGSKSDVVQLSEMKTFSHSPSEKHTGTLLSLSSARYLPLFCSLATDNHVKLWNIECLLVREVYLGVNLRGACFVPNLCVLILASTNNLWVTDKIFSTENGIALLGNGGHQCSSGHLENAEGVSVSFDPSLEFWYDPSRSKQRSIDPHSPSHGLFVPRPATPSPCARRMAPSGVHLQENQAAISTKTHLSGRSQRMHDAQLGVGIQPRYCKQGEMNCTEERACKSVMGNSGRIGSGSTFLQASDETVQNKLLPQQSFVARDERCRSADISLFFDDIDRFGRLPPFHIPRSVLLKNPHLASDKFPVAPDGYIPNSIIRGKFSLRKVSESPVSIRPSCMGLSLNLSSLVTHSRHQKSPTLNFDDDGRSSKSSSRPCSGSIDSMGRMSPGRKSTSADISARITMMSNLFKNFKDSGSKKQRPAKSSANACERLTLSPRPRLKVDLEDVDLDLSMGYAGHRPAKKQLQRKPHPRPHPDTESDFYDSDASPSYTPSPQLLSERLGTSLSIASCDDNSQANTASQHNMVLEALKDQPSSQYSGSYGTQNSSHVRLRNFPAEELSIARNRVKAERPHSNGFQQLLDHITSQEWYPKEFAARSSSARQVVDNLIKLMEATNPVHVFQEVCASLGGIHDAEICPPEAYTVIEDIAAHQLLSRADSAKICLLEMITRLHLHGRNLLQSVISLLGSDNVGVREATFRALDRLAGVTSRAELKELMMELGLITEEEELVNSDVEVLKEVAQLLRNRYKRQGIDSLRISLPDGSHELNHTTVHPSDSHHIRQLPHGSSDSTHMRQLQHGLNDSTHIRGVQNGLNDSTYIRGVQSGLNGSTLIRQVQHGYNDDSTLNQQLQHGSETFHPSSNNNYSITGNIGMLASHSSSNPGSSAQKSQVKEEHCAHGPCQESSVQKTSAVVSSSKVLTGSSSSGHGQATVKTNDKKQCVPSNTHPVVKRTVCIAHRRQHLANQDTATLDNRGSCKSLKSLPLPVRRWLVKNPAQMPEEILSFLYQTKASLLEKTVNRYSWCEVHPILKESECSLPKIK